MKLTAKVKLQPTPDQHAALLQTLEAANTACNTISDVAWSERVFGRVPLHRLVYHDIRKASPLSAQLVVHCIGKVVDAYKLDRKTKRTFRPHGAIAYDSRILRWFLAEQEVSIWTVAGRERIPFACGERDRRLLESQRGEADLCLVNGEFYLFTACEVETPEPAVVSEFLGVDFGITNIAVDSDGETCSASQVKNVRYRHRRLRKKLQKRGTKSARRRLKRLSGKEHRFAKDVNHTISKRIVAKAKGTGRGIALEELSGIRDRVTVRRCQRATLHSWSFRQLRQYIEYKARLAGIPVVAVDAHNTSRTCPVCGCVDKRNRPSQSKFSCTSCGYAGFADYIAAGNIASRAAVNPPNVSDARFVA